MGRRRRPTLEAGDANAAEQTPDNPTPDKPEPEGDNKTQEEESDMESIPAEAPKSSLPPAPETEHEQSRLSIDMSEIERLRSERTQLLSSTPAKPSSPPPELPKVERGRPGANVIKFHQNRPEPGDKEYRLIRLFVMTPKFRNIRDRSIRKWTELPWCEDDTRQKDTATIPRDLPEKLRLEWKTGDERGDLENPTHGKAQAGMPYYEAPELSKSNTSSMNKYPVQLDDNGYPFLQMRRSTHEFPVDVRPGDAYLGSMLLHYGSKNLHAYFPADVHPDGRIYPDRLNMGSAFKPRSAHKDFVDKEGNLVFDERIAYMRLTTLEDGPILWFCGEGTTVVKVMEGKWADLHHYGIDITNGVDSLRPVTQEPEEISRQDHYFQRDKFQPIEGGSSFNIALANSAAAHQRIQSPNPLLSTAFEILDNIPTRQYETRKPSWEHFNHMAVTAGIKDGTIDILRNNNRVTRKSLATIAEILRGTLRTVTNHRFNDEKDIAQASLDLQKAFNEVTTLHNEARAIGDLVNSTSESIPTMLDLVDQDWLVNGRVRNMGLNAKKAILLAANQVPKGYARLMDDLSKDSLATSWLHPQQPEPLSFYKVKRGNPATTSYHIHRALDELVANPMNDRACSTTFLNMTNKVVAERVYVDNLLVPNATPSSRRKATPRASDERKVQVISDDGTSIHSSPPPNPRRNSEGNRGSMSSPIVVDDKQVKHSYRKGKFIKVKVDSTDGEGDVNVKPARRLFTTDKKKANKRKTISPIDSDSDTPRRGRRSLRTISDSDDPVPKKAMKTKRNQTTKANTNAVTDRSEEDSAEEERSDEEPSDEEQTEVKQKKKDEEQSDDQQTEVKPKKKDKEVQQAEFEALNRKYKSQSAARYNTQAAAKKSKQKWLSDNDVLPYTAHPKGSVWRLHRVSGNRREKVRAIIKKFGAKCGKNTLADVIKTLTIFVNEHGLGLSQRGVKYGHMIPRPTTIDELD